MSGPLLLHVAVPADEATGALGRALGARSVVHARLAAILGPVRQEGSTRAALRHARIVARALETCTSVVPFRAGIEVASAQEALDLLAENRAELSARLRDLAGHVEMGLKVRIPGQRTPAAGNLEAALDRIRALAPRADHRQERRRALPGATVLEASYLVHRARIEPFWSAVAALRDDTGLRVLGTGPWAPYSFCDLSLRAASRAPPGAPPLERSLS